MRTRRSRFSWIVAGALAALGCGEAQPSASADASSAAVQAGCVDCNAVMDACLQTCLARANGDPATYWYVWNPCVNECVQTQLVPCTQAQSQIVPIWSYAGPTMTLCHIDPDTHMDGVDVELYSADRYVDTSCRSSPDAYRKRRVASVHCGWNSKSVCGSRVTAKITELAGQGYVPLTTEPDRDLCPTPRLP